MQEYVCFAAYGARQARDALQSGRRVLELDTGRTDARVNMATVTAIRADRDGASSYLPEALWRRSNSAKALAKLGLAQVAKCLADLADETDRTGLQMRYGFRC